jgi:hypothetical protein
MPGAFPAIRNCGGLATLLLVTTFLDEKSRAAKNV